jgi:hypothetical protein
LILLDRDEDVLDPFTEGNGSKECTSVEKDPVKATSNWYGVTATSTGSEVNVCRGDWMA